jgi:stage V sporulation protein R
VENANFENRGELLLTHLYEGVDMQPDYMRETLKNIQAIWGRPVHLATVQDNQARLITHDGVEIKETVLADPTQSSAG